MQEINNLQPGDKVTCAGRKVLHFHGWVRLKASTYALFLGSNGEYVFERYLMLINASYSLVYPTWMSFSTRIQ